MVLQIKSHGKGKVKDKVFFLIKSLKKIASYLLNFVVPKNQQIYINISNINLSLRIFFWFWNIFFSPVFFIIYEDWIMF